MEKESESKTRNFVYFLEVSDKISKKVRNSIINSFKIDNKIGKITLKISAIS
jgi:hypothetical protein